jgi:hypothetical protein
VADNHNIEKYFTVTAAATSAAPTMNQLSFFESMTGFIKLSYFLLAYDNSYSTAGAISRSIAQTLMHPGKLMYSIVFECT